MKKAEYESKIIGILKKTASVMRPELTARTNNNEFYTIFEQIFNKSKDLKIKADGYLIISVIV